MSVRGFFRRVGVGAALNRLASRDNMEKVFNILEDIEGVNCRIEKPTDAEGKGWRIVVDGSSDTLPPGGADPPWTNTEDYPWRVTATPDGDGGATVSMTPGWTFNLGRRTTVKVELADQTVTSSCWVVLECSLDATASTTPQASVQSGWASRNTETNLCVPIAHVQKKTNGVWTVDQHLWGTFMYPSFVGEEA